MQFFYSNVSSFYDYKEYVKEQCNLVNITESDECCQCGSSC
jgi:hypothetical protein